MKYEIFIEGGVSIIADSDEAAQAEVSRIQGILDDLSIDADCWDEDDILGLDWEVSRSEGFKEDDDD